MRWGGQSVWRWCWQRGKGVGERVDFAMGNGRKWSMDIDSIFVVGRICWVSDSEGKNEGWLICSTGFIGGDDDGEGPTESLVPFPCTSLSWKRHHFANSTSRRCDASRHSVGHVRSSLSCSLLLSLVARWRGRAEEGRIQRNEFGSRLQLLRVSIGRVDGWVMDELDGV